MVNTLTLQQVPSQPQKVVVSGQDSEIFSGIQLEGCSTGKMNEAQPDFIKVA